MANDKRRTKGVPGQERVNAVREVYLLAGPAHALTKVFLVGT